MKKISRDTAISISIGAIIILANSWHVISAWFSRPPDTFFTGIAHYYADYFLYISFMVQKGWIFTDHLFTNEALSPTWIYWLYTVLGKFGNPFIIYNVSIIVFAIIVLIFWWKLINELVQKKYTQYIAFLFVATASGFAGNDFWFSPTPALNRLGGVPHQLFQTILLLAVLFLFQKRRYALLAVVSFVAATANPIQMLLLSVSLVITKPIMALYLIPAAIGALLTNLEFARQPILAAAKAWENNQPFSVGLLQFILAVGPILFLIPFGVKQIMKEIMPIRRVFLAYGILSVLIFFSPIPHLLGTSPTRWLSPAAYGIFPIIAAFGMPKKLTIGILIAYLFLTAPSIRIQVIARMQAPKSLQYVPILFIEKLRNTDGNGVVLTNPALPYDVLVPAFTGRKSFTGHPVHTLYPDIKETLRQKYFADTSTEAEKKKFLVDHSITTIIP